MFAGAGISVTGTIVGYRDVWNVFSFGTIDAGIVALGLTEGGIVHKVQGVTSVAGTILANAAFEYGRTGGEWTATVSAPTTPAPVIIDHDATMAGEFPVPSPIVLDKLAIRAVLAAVYGVHLIEKTGYDVLKSVKVTATASKRQDVLNEIAASRSKQERRADDLEFDQYDAWLDEVDAMGSWLSRLRASASIIEQSQISDLEAARKDGIELRQTAIDSGSAILSSAQEDSKEALMLMKLYRDMARSDVLAVRISASAGLHLMLQMQIDEGWQLVNLLAGGTSYGQAEQKAKSIFDRGKQVYNNAKDAGASDAEAALQVGAILFFDAVGAMKVYHAVTGMDPVTLHTYTQEQRFAEAIFGTIQIVQTAISVAETLDQMKGPCGGYLTERCFVGETLVLTGENAPWAYAEHVGLQLTESQQLSLAQWCWILGLGSAVVAFGAAKLSDDRRKKRGALTANEINDDLFAADPENRFLDGETTMPRHSVARSQVADHDQSSAVASESDSSDNSAMNRTPEIAAPRCKPRAAFVTRGLGIMAAVLLAVGTLFSIRDAGGPPSPISVASADVQRSEQTSARYSSKPIRDIQPIADRVLADNPETDGQAPSDFGEFRAADWKILRLLVLKPDHEWMKVTLARPQAWIEAARRDSEGRIWLEFKELGIANWANVLAIEPCPEAAVGEGRLVTGKFEHSSAEVIDLFVDGVSEPIGTTSNHPFWSEDRRDFVQAGQLRIGERLRLRDGSTPVVTAVVPRSQSVAVFNLEVDGEHVYYVSTSGVLVHNSDSYIDDREYTILHGSDRESVREMAENGLSAEAARELGGGDSFWALPEDQAGDIELFGAANPAGGEPGTLGIRISGKTLNRMQELGLLEVDPESGFMEFKGPEAFEMLNDFGEFFEVGQ